MGLKLNEGLNEGGLEGVVLGSLDLWRVQALHCSCSLLSLVCKAPFALFWSKYLIKQPGLLVFFFLIL